MCLQYTYVFIVYPIRGKDIYTKHGNIFKVPKSIFIELFISLYIKWHTLKGQYIFVEDK